MDTGSCGFQMSAREIDLLAAPEEEFNSRNSISSLLNSAPAAAPDPAASLQQSFFDAIASYLDHSAPRSLNSLPNAENWPHFPQRKGLQRSFSQAAVDSQLPAELIISSSSSNHPSQVQVQVSAQPSPAAASNMGSIAGVVQQKPYATGASTSAAEHLEAGEWSHAARAARPSGGSASATSDSGTAKAGKKRSRASRRAPTTVLTTDTSNFRAMVQEFTGIPTAPFSAAPFPRSRVDFLGAPRSSLHGGAAAAPPFLLRPYPHRTSSTAPPPAANFGYAPPAANSAAPPPSFLLQSLLQAQQQQQQPPPKDSISFPAGSFAGKSPGGLLEELGLSVVLPDLVPSDSSACKNMMSNYNAVKDRVSERRSSPLEESADRNPPRAERSIVDSWINPSSG